MDVGRTDKRVLLTALLYAALAACGLRTSNIVLIPDGYVGWVLVLFKTPSAPVLSKDRGKYLLVIPPSGILRTSSPLEFGYGMDEYFYVLPSGERVRLALEGVERKDEDMVHTFQYQTAPAQIELFFVGPRSSIGDYPKPDLTSSPR